MGFIKDLVSNIGFLSNSEKVDKLPLSDVGITQVNLAAKKEGKQAIFQNWFFSARLGQPRGTDIPLLRNLGNSPWVQMVVGPSKKQVLTMDWDIVKADEKDETDREANIKICKEFMKLVNPNGQTISDVNSEIVTDLMEVDAGVPNFIYSADSYVEGDIEIIDELGRVVAVDRGFVLKPLGKRTLVQIKTADAGTVLKQIDIHKNLVAYWQYSFKHPRQAPIRFEKEELSYLLLNSKSYSVYGFSPLQALQQVIEVLIQGTRYNKDLYVNNAVPKMLISLPKLPLAQLKKLKRTWNNQYQGKPHQVGFVNWLSENVIKLSESNRDLEWLNGQAWYSKIVFGVYGLSPTEAGFFENSNKSNDEGQERTTIRNALKPYLTIIEQLHTTRTITEILQDENHGLKFKFFPKDHAAEKIEFEQDMKELEVGALTINEYREKKGKEKVEWGDEPLRRPMNPEDLNSNSGGVPNSPLNISGSPPNNPKPPKPDKAFTKGKHGKAEEEEDDEENKPKKDLDAGEDTIEESKNYAEFLDKTFSSFERSALRAVDSLGFGKSPKMNNEYNKKNFGDFLRGLFNKVNTVAFASKVKQFLKIDLVAGMEQAEKETNIDIGFTESFSDKLAKLQGQQVDGYMINGKKWPGIKGVTKEIQQKTIQAVQGGINAGKSNKEIKEDIKDVFGGFSDWRSNMIARTETSRILAEGKLLGYKESGLKGKKVWSTALDNRTSPICRRLNGQVRELDEPFKDPETLKEFMTPAAHPNCRSSIYFVPN